MYRSWSCMKTRVAAGQLLTGSRVLLGEEIPSGGRSMPKVDWSRGGGKPVLFIQKAFDPGAWDTEDAPLLRSPD